MAGFRVLFIDTVAVTPYDDVTARLHALGGTEATVVRVAGELSRFVEVAVAQRAREVVRRGEDGVLYLPYDHKEVSSPWFRVDAIVVVRSHKLLKRVRRRFPDARLLLWMHCFPGRRVKDLGRHLLRSNTSLVAVSHHHRRVMTRFITEREGSLASAIPMEVAYNPLAPGLRADPRSEYDPDKLLFLSSPHKGLDEVVRHFLRLRNRFPNLRLHVANPGYLDWAVPQAEGIVHLGKLPHSEASRHLRESFCLFYPQRSFAETFGLVFAEANAVGTPVMAHPLGAAPEILGDDTEQLVDAGDDDAVLDRFVAWRRDGRPQVEGRPEFEIAAVCHNWLSILTRRTSNARFRKNRMELDATA